MRTSRLQIKDGVVIYPELSYELVGIFYAVHNELGRYCNEKQYADLVEQKLKEHNLKYVREMVLDKYFNSERIGRHRIDFLVDDKIVVEIKCKRILDRNEYYQVRRYLTVLDKKLAILVNFRDKYLHPRRILNSQATI